jgi:16S rRNA (uracil1498-N3)-methyltransferase
MENDKVNLSFSFLFMALPFFYTKEIKTQVNQFVLNEETSKHIVQVLRMQNGEQLNLADGVGNIYLSTITDNNKRGCKVEINSTINTAKPIADKTISISILKNASRFEWFLEKATEIGITKIIPLICDRTERIHFRHDRMNSILISAMLQSQQSWLPVLSEPVQFDDLMIAQFDNTIKLIAHCEEDKKQALNTQLIHQSSNQIILIGPEGDFSKEEIILALNNNFIPVTLGNTRLRTETAGIVAATLLCNL